MATDPPYPTRSHPIHVAHPLHTMLSGFPLACFTGALLADITYVNTYDMQWANFSVWLLTFGLATGMLAAVSGIVVARRDRTARPAWPHELGGVVALVLALFNAFVHSRDGYTSVMPVGFTLSMLTVLVLVVSTWFGAAVARRSPGEVR